MDWCPIWYTPAALSPNKSSHLDWPVTCSETGMPWIQPDPADSSYPFLMEWKQQIWPDRSLTGALFIALMILLLAVLSMAVPVSYIAAHNILHHLNFIPLMMAGMLFGRRGAIVASLLAAGVNAPLIARNWIAWPLDSQDQIVELSIFSAAGLIAGCLSDRERAHRHNLEQTKRELEKVYLELRENVASMKKAERLLAAGQLAACLAHEIRNPLASISGAAGILRRAAAPPEFLEDSLDIIHRESQRLNKLLTGFLNFAKPRSLRLQSADPDAILHSVASLACHAADVSNISLAHDAIPDCPEIECDTEQIRQVLLNLVINAIDASPSGSQIRLRTMVGPNRISIEVEDKGTGIPEEIADRIFDPFFTTKAKGTGLGLAVSSTIVEQHCGAMSFYRNSNGGTTFRVELPCNRETTYGR